MTNVTWTFGPIVTDNMVLLSSANSRQIIEYIVVYSSRTVMVYTRISLSLKGEDILDIHIRNLTQN